MEFLKDVFGDKALTYAELETALKGNKDIKLANLASGQYVDKAKLEKAEGDLKTKDETIRNLQALDAEGLKSKLNTLQKKYDDDIGDLNAKLSEQILNSKVDMALKDVKAKNLKAVRSLLEMEKISMENGEPVGLQEQIDSIIKENPDFFGETKNPPPPVAGGSVDNFTTEMNKWRAEAGLAPLNNKE